MSDTEVQQKSSLEASSADESSVSEAKMSQVSEEAKRQRQVRTWIFIIPAFLWVGVEKNGCWLD